MEEKKAFQLEVVSIRLVRDAPIMSEIEISSPEDAVSLGGSVLCEMDREIICVINLRGDNVPINCNFVSMGSVNYSLAHPREMLKSSILSNAAGIIMCHNHPSGKIEPSEDDMSITLRMYELCELVGIPLMDHLIIGRDNKEYFSFKENGIIGNISQNCQPDYECLNWDNQPIAAEKEAENEVYRR